MTPGVNEGIIRKIQKLLALGQSPNEAEANLAIAMAQEMLAKHNLDFAMVQDTYVAGGTASAPEEKREKVRVSRSAKYRWQQDLWRAICEANFCWHSIVWVFEGKRGTKSTTSRVRVKRHMILGRESNVVAVKLMGEYLEDTMERLVVSEGGYTNQERLSRGANSWKCGCSDRLSERIREDAEKRKEASTADPNSKAIVLRDVFQAEYQANYDFRYGAGAYAQKLLQDAEWEAGQEERERRAEEARLKAEKDWLEYLKTETPQQKKQRERQEEKELIAEEKRQARANRSWWRETRQEESKLDGVAYSRGAKAANKVNLGAQIGAPGSRKDRSLT